VNVAISPLTSPPSRRLPSVTDTEIREHRGEPWRDD